MRKAMRQWTCASIFAIITAGTITGCGGGGSSSSGSSSASGSQQQSIVTISGTLQDKLTGILLANRTVTVQGTSLSGVTSSTGVFVIANVPVTTITLIVTDSTGAVDGSPYSVDVSKTSGSPRSLGTIVLDVSGGTAAPPAGPIL